MEPIPFIDDVIGATCAGLETASEPCKFSTKAPLHKLDNIDEEATTDIGQSSASEAESSSGISSDEGSRRMGRRCRFAGTSLETIPATPTAGAMTLSSPPGLSRAGMRAARDACKKASADIPEQNPSGAEFEANTLATSGVTLSRFGDTPFGTVPKTPVGKAKWKNLQGVFGSPPGLSRAEKRHARDACKGSWGGVGSASASTLSSGSNQRRAAREELASMKERAALLKEVKAKQALATSEDAESQNLATDNHSESSEAEESLEAIAAKGQRCRFDGTALGTMPSTPVRKEVTASPPGLSRKAMRQARDSCSKASTIASTSWGTGTGAAFTISPAGKPMTPPAERAARQRASREATNLAWGGVSMPAVPQTSAMAR